MQTLPHRTFSEYEYCECEKFSLSVVSLSLYKLKEVQKVTSLLKNFSWTFIATDIMDLYDEMHSKVFVKVFFSSVVFCFKSNIS